MKWGAECTVRVSLEVVAEYLLRHGDVHAFIGET